MANHIERRHNVWYATLVIPPDVREQLGLGFKFFQTLKTPDKRRAIALAAPLVAKWQAQIRQARGEGDAVTIEALKWREVLLAERAASDAAPATDDGYVDDVGVEVTREHIITLAEAIEKTADYTTAKRFADIALGVTMPSDSHYGPWAAQLKLAPKTIDQMKKDVRLLIKRFPTLQAITHQSVKGWLDELTAQQVSPSSQERMMSFCRNFWGYLQTHNAVPSDSQPFTKLAGNKIRKKRNSKRSDGVGPRVPFSAPEVVTLWKEAHHKLEDEQLADLIMLGAYTGARIEELCSLEVKDVAKASFKIVDAKTDAGVREVPIHSKIAKLVQRLKRTSKDDYLLSGLTFNKYGDRSNAIGKRFGRMKAALGFGEHQVFHSLRKTLVTLMENAGVPEGVTADIVGHEKKTMTYGVYSGGTSLEVKAEAIERVKYPFGGAPTA